MCKLREYFVALASVQLISANLTSVDPESVDLASLPLAPVNVANINHALINLDYLIDNGGLDRRVELDQYKKVAKLQIIWGLDAEENAFILSKPFVAMTRHWREIKRKLWKPLWEICFPKVAHPQICSRPDCESRHDLERHMFGFAEAVLKRHGTVLRATISRSGECLTSGEITNFVRVVTGPSRARVRDHILTCAECGDSLRDRMRGDGRERQKWFNRMQNEHLDALNEYAMRKIEHDHMLAEDLVAGVFKDKARWGLAFDRANNGKDDKENIDADTDKEKTDKEKIRVRKWLTNTFDNLRIDWFRRYPEPLGSLDDPNRPEQESQEPGYNAIEINDFLNEHLTAEERRYYDMKFVEGMTLQEISEEVKKPLGTVNGKITRMLIRLAEAMHDDGLI